ncbi:hypothetical protein CRYUN_Cryun09bG0109100 [Craigia yunnanensis]
MKATRSRAAARKDNKEAVKPVEDRIIGKRKAALQADKSNKKRTNNVTSAKKDPNKPKRPPTAFFVFLEEFRIIYKQEHPKVKAVSAEKAPYEAKAAKRKSEYEKLMAAYNKKLENIDDEEEAESETSKSQVNDKEDEESEEDEEGEDDD